MGWSARCRGAENVAGGKPPKGSGAIISVDTVKKKKDKDETPYMSGPQRRSRIPDVRLKIDKEFVAQGFLGAP